MTMTATTTATATATATDLKLDRIATFAESAAGPSGPAFGPAFVDAFKRAPLAEKVAIERSIGITSHHWTADDEAALAETFAESEWVREPTKRTQNRWRHRKTGKIRYSKENPAKGVREKKATAKDAERAKNNAEHLAAMHDRAKAVKEAITSPAKPAKESQFIDAIRDAFVNAPNTSTDPNSRGAKFGDKVFISHIRNEVMKKFPGMTKAEFDHALGKAHVAGDVELSRADLVSVMHPKDVAESEISHPGFESTKYHFVRDVAKPTPLVTKAIAPVLADAPPISDAELHRIFADSSLELEPDDITDAIKADRAAAPERASALAKIARENPDAWRVDADAAQSAIDRYDNEIAVASKEHPEIINDTFFDAVGDVAKFEFDRLTQKYGVVGASPIIGLALSGAIVGGGIAAATIGPSMLMLYNILDGGETTTKVIAGAGKAGAVLFAMPALAIAHSARAIGRAIKSAVSTYAETVGDTTLTPEQAALAAIDFIDAVKVRSIMAAKARGII